MLLSTNFTGKCRLVFVLTKKSGFILQPTERPWVSLKTVLGILKLPLFTRSTYFYVTITRYFISFQCFNSETIFSEKLKSFLETTIIESTTFPYKTDLSKANLKANRMESTK